MITLNKALQDFACDDCGLDFSDYREFLNHRKYHTVAFRSTITEETLLEESCPLCLVKYPEKYEDTCLEELLGSGRAIGTSERGAELSQILRCKYYPKCDQEFYGLHEYANHARKIHHDDRPFMCQQCNYTTNKYSSLMWHLRKHLRMHFPAPNTTTCQLRSEDNPTSPRAEDRPTSRCKLPAPAKCHLCPKKYTRHSNLQQHLLSHQEIDKISHDCIYCGQKYTTFADFKMHLRTHFPITNTTKCHLCPEVLPCKRKLVAHIKKHYKAFKCHRCPKEYSMKHNLMGHLLLVHKEADVESHDCSNCGRKFAAKYQLNRHLEKHRPIRTKDSLHPKKCVRVSQSKQHISDHKKADENSNECKYCGRKCTDSADLKMHLKIHFPTPNTTKCHVCSKEYAVSARLKWHIKTHFTVFKCHLCPKEYAGKSSMQNHLLSVHRVVNIDSYDCPYCDKRYTTPSKLKLHVQKHLRTRRRRKPIEEDEPKKYACHLCPKKYYAKSSLNYHVLTHKISKRDLTRKRYALGTNLKQILPYKCYCGKRFHKPNLLLAHLESHLSIPNQD